MPVPLPGPPEVPDVLPGPPVVPFVVPGPPVMPDGGLVSTEPLGPPSIMCIVGSGVPVGKPVVGGGAGLVVVGGLVVPGGAVGGTAGGMVVVVVGGAGGKGVVVVGVLHTVPAGQPDVTPPVPVPVPVHTVPAGQPDVVPPAPVEIVIPLPNPVLVDGLAPVQSVKLRHPVQVPPALPKPNSVAGVLYDEVTL